jgi:hypothetical protein
MGGNGVCGLKKAAADMAVVLEMVGVVGSSGLRGYAMAGLSGEETTDPVAAPAEEGDVPGGKG